MGGPILKVLLADGSFNISILSRSASNPSFPRGVKVHQTDYSVDSLVKAFEGQDAVVSAMGSTALDSQFAMVEAAAKAGVKRFLPSEMGINQLGPEMAAMPTLDVKHKVVDALKKRESQGLSWTGLFNGPFYDWVSQYCRRDLTFPSAIFCLTSDT